MNISHLLFMNVASYALLLVSAMVPGSFYQAWLPYALIAFSFPHFMATYWIWGKRVREWKREWWPMIFPPVWLAVFLLSAYRLIPIRTDQLVKGTYYFLIYHFARQLYGTTLWQFKNWKLPSEKWHRYLLQALFLTCAFYALLDLEIRGATKVLFYHPTLPLYFPPPLLSGLFALSVLLLTFVTIWILCRYLKSGNLRELIPLSSVSIAWIWFIPPMSHNMIFFLPMAHAFQYYPFVWMKNKNVPLGRWGIAVGLLVLTGWFFFRFLPFQVDLFPGGLWPVMILTLLNNHHFIIDGRIWKLGDPRNQDLF